MPNSFDQFFTLNEGRTAARPQATSGLPSDRFRVAFDSAPIGVALVAPDGRYLEVNDALCRMLGYEPQELLELSFVDVTHPDDRAATRRRRARQLRGEPGQTRIEKRYVRSDGRTIWVAVRSTLVHDAGGAPAYSIAQIEDISDRVQAQRALLEAEERFRRAFEDAPIGMAIVALDGRWLQVNDRLCEITGYAEQELLSHTFMDITHPDDVDKNAENLEMLLSGRARSVRIEKRYLRPDGTVVWVNISSSLIEDAGGSPLQFVSQIEDVTERRRAEEKLRHLADHDPLTGLLNRRRLNEELGRELLLITHTPGRAAALLLLDIDRFKHVNDTLGHAAGDNVLRAVADTLRSTLNGHEIVARLGGDEFAVVLADLATTDEARRIATRLAHSLRSRTVQTRNGDAEITVSIGVVPLDHSIIGTTDPLIVADNAMYAAKRKGRNRIEIAA